MNRQAISFTIERLRQIAADQTLIRHFTLSYWGNQLDIHELDQAEDPACGFTGCYMGWAIHQQWYAGWGLKMAFVDNASRFPAPDKRSVYPVVQASSTLGFQRFVPHSGHDGAVHAMSAVAHLLGLQGSTLEKVIYEEAYENGNGAGPGDVADRFAEILELGENGFMDVQVEREERWHRLANGH